MSCKMLGLWCFFFFFVGVFGNNSPVCSIGSFLGAEDRPCICVIYLDFSCTLFFFLCCSPHPDRRFRQVHLLVGTRQIHFPGSRCLYGNIHIRCKGQFWNIGCFHSGLRRGGLLQGISHRSHPLLPGILPLFFFAVIASCAH